MESRRIKRIVNDHSTLDIELDRVYTRTILSGPWHTTFLMVVARYEGTVLAASSRVWLPTRQVLG